MSTATSEPKHPPIYILCNRVQEVDRYNFLCSHLPARGINMDRVHWIAGPWGSELTSEQVFSLWKPYGPRPGCEKAINFKAQALIPGEISLNNSFYTLIGKVCAQQDPYVIVFESDIVLREDFLERLDTVLKESAEWPGGWDYISLGEGVGTRPKEVNQLASYYGPTKLYPPAHQWVFRCCDSMVLKRDFLEKVRGTFLPFRECLDWELNYQFAIHKGRAIWVDPPLVEAASGRHRVPTFLPC